MSSRAVVGSDRIYPTKVDWWLGLILAATPAITIVTAVLMVLDEGGAGWLSIGLSVVFVALSVWICRIPFNTNYELDHTELVVRSAGFSWRIPFERIQKVSPTHNPLSSPACSLDRLNVAYVNDKGHSRFVLISPREKEAFLRDLAQAVPGAQYCDGQLVTESKEES